MKNVVIIILFILISAQCLAVQLGFNQAWLHNRYQHQWIHYDHSEAIRIIDLAKNANAKILRMWLFEGSNAKGILWKNNRPVSLSPVFLKNLEDFIQYAHEQQIQLNLTLFDGNIILQKSFKDYKNRWWNLLNNKNQVADLYLQKIILPILDLFKKYPHTVGQIDLINEINALNRVNSLFKNRWSGVNKFVCKWSSFIKENTDYDIKMTTSFGWANASSLILSDKLNARCIDFYDLHLYNDSGEIPACSKLQSFAHKKHKEIQIGEFGQKSKEFNSDLQSEVLKKFFINANKCGIKQILAWRLSDIRKGNNTEARLSFEAFGKPRAAYYIFRDLNKINF